MGMSTVRQYGYGKRTDILCTNSVPLKMWAQNSHVLWYRNQKQVHHSKIYCLLTPHDTYPEAVLISNLLLTAAARELCRSEHEEIMSRTSAHFKQYLSSKSRTALHEAFRNEVPGKTKQQLTPNGEIQKTFWVRNMSDIRQQWQVRLSTSMMRAWDSSVFTDDLHAVCSVLRANCETTVFWGHH